MEIEDDDVAMPPNFDRNKKIRGRRAWTKPRELKMARHENLDHCCRDCFPVLSLSGPLTSSDPSTGATR